MNKHSLCFRAGAAIALGLKFVMPALADESSTTPPANGATNSTPTTVGEKPKEEKPQVTTQDVFAERSALTQRGHLIIESGLTYSHTDTQRTNVQGFTVLPSLLIGALDISQVRSDLLNPFVTLRYGVTSRFEIEARFPYVYRQDEEVLRPLLQGSQFDDVIKTSGSDIGDIEATAHFQFTTGLGTLPILIGNLRVKSNTGTGPFDVKRQTIFGTDAMGMPTTDVIGMQWACLRQMS